MTDRPSSAAPLGLFLVRLAAALNAAEFPVDEVQRRVEQVGAANGVMSVRTSAFPTYVMVALSGEEPVSIEVTPAAGGSPRLDRIDAVERLADAAAAGTIEPSEGLAQLEQIASMPYRFGRLVHVVGYAILTAGLCLVLRPSRGETLAAAGLGIFVGAIDLVGRRPSPIRVLLPVTAAFGVALVTGLLARAGWADPGIRPIVASLVVFLPGATLTTAVLELGSGQTVSGASRLVGGALSLAMLAFGILAGFEAAGLPAHQLVTARAAPLGPWAPWLGVVLFAVGVSLTHSVPRPAVPGLTAVLLAAWVGQVAGTAAFGVFVGAFLGAIVLVVASSVVAKAPRSMAGHASFLPGFWVLVPGALGLIGLTRWAGSGGVVRVGDLMTTVGSIFAVAIGVLFGSQIWKWLVLTGRAVDGASASVTRTTHELRRRARPHRRGSDHRGREEQGPASPG